MGSKDFEITRLIGNGCYSTIYDAVSTREIDRGTKYALKRIFILNASALICAIREHRTLLHLAMESDRSPFVITLFYSFRVHRSPVLVMTRGSGIDLSDLLCEVGNLNEDYARFYICEVICGLEFLHAKGIIHLDIKPENMLISDSGHILITDFSHAYDRCRRLNIPLFKGSLGTPHFMAPEVAKKVALTTKADVWSLAILMAVMIAGPVRKLPISWNEDCELAKKGLWSISNLDRLTPPLKYFFKCCLRFDHETRPSIDEVKDLSFFSDIKWNDVVACKTQPPYIPSDLQLFNDRVKFGFNPRDPLILQSAYGVGMPVIWRIPQFVIGDDKTLHLVTLFSNYEKLIDTGLPLRKIEKYFTSYNFTHPLLQDSEPSILPSTSTSVSETGETTKKCKRRSEGSEFSAEWNSKRLRTSTNLD
ncbi:RAC-beta serine/threonine-protein kinase [Taenia crassiceps]|uniref:RAC-beta serine/threonine-protein kinase n=1 Tax=Taenia crassiceps TaxID=6207 RepID=A0ABR4Q6Q2_9CEST